MDATNLVNSKIGMGFELDGIDDFINISESSSLDSTNDGGTLSLWINWENSSKTGKYQRIMTTNNRFNYENPVHRDGFEWAVNQWGDNFFYPWGGNGDNYNQKNDPFTNEIWHYLILTFDYSNKNVTMYLDGSPMAFDTVNVDTHWTQLAELEDWLWGVSVNVSQLGHFEGKFDEIRVSNITRSAEWIATEYNNQNNPSNFYSLGSALRVDSTPPIWSNLGYTDPLELGNAETLIIDVFDYSGVAQVLFDIENTNYTMVNIGGDTWKNDTWTPSSTGDYDFTIHMQDTHGNWNTTSGSIQVVDTTGPSWSNLIYMDPLEFGIAENITIQVVDLSGVSEVLFEIEGNN